MRLVYVNFQHNANLNIRENVWKPQIAKTSTTIVSQKIEPNLVIMYYTNEAPILNPWNIYACTSFASVINSDVFFACDKLLTIKYILIPS